MTRMDLCIAANFTAEPLEESLNFWAEHFGVPMHIDFAPYNQIFQQLLDTESAFRRNRDGVNVILLHLEEWIRGDHLPRAADGLQRSIEDVCAAIRSFASQAAAPLILCFSPRTPAGEADAELRAELDQAEQRLSSDVATIASVRTIGSGWALGRYPVDDYYDPHGHELGQVPYTPECYAAIGTSLFRVLFNLRETPFKVIVLDCDNTLWAGVCGEAGSSGIQVTPPYRELQAFMIEQMNAGMLLCLCSKNNEEDVLDVFDQRPDMLLKSEHFVSRRINWKSKSTNITSLATELNLGLDSFIFVDDNPLECADVRIHCPEVLTLQLPRNAESVPSFLEHVWAFDHASVTDEDRGRTRMYQENREREKVRDQTVSFADFINTLELRVTIDEPTSDQLNRVSQLTVRTNQFNLTSVRRSEDEVRRFVSRQNARCLVVHVTDRFGDYGLSGVVMYETEADRYKVDTLLLSCRVLGRGVEHAVVASLGQRAVQEAKAFVELTYRPTAKNVPAVEFIKSVGDQYRDEGGALAQTDQSSNTSRPFDARVGSAGSWTVPAGYLASLEFNADHKTQAGDGARAVASPEGLSPFRATVPGVVDLSERMQRAAEHLRGTSQIAMAIDECRHKQRPPAPPATAAPDGTLETEDLDAVEQALAGIWEELLKVDHIGRDDDFFALGGHSLMAIRLLSRIERRFHAGLGVSAVFDWPTLGGLSAVVRERLGVRARDPEQFSPQGGTGAGPAPAAPSRAPGPVLGPVSREAFRTSLVDLSGEGEE